MHKSLVLALAAAAAISSQGEVKSWYWNGTKQHAIQPSWGADPDSPENWLDAAGNQGIPGRGDTVYIQNKGLKITSNNGATKYPWGDVYWTGGTPMQFFLCLETGHKVQIGGNWVGTCGLYLYGNGETEIESTSGADLKFQKPFAAKEGKPTLVKNGKWTLICYYQAGSRDYTIPYTKIKQGTLNITTSKTQKGLLFMFDGNDETARFEYTTQDGKTIHADDLVLQDSAIVETNGVDNTKHGINSSFGGQLAFTGKPTANPMMFTGTFYGSSGLRWSPSADEYSFVCSKAVSPTTGKMTVEKGTLKLADGASFTALSELAVSAGATFEVEAGSGANFSAVTLSLASNAAKLKLGPGVSLKFNGAYKDGAAMAPGTYSADDADGHRKADWIEGEGTVVVLTGPANSDTWVGADAGGDSLELGGNWKMGAKPDFSAGDLLATFASGGEAATLSGAAKFDGLVFRNDFGGSGFAFRSGTDAAAEVGASGITMMDAAAATMWTMYWPLTLTKAQEWSLGANNTLRLAGGFAGDQALTVSGSGTMELTEASTHSGALTLQSGQYVVSGDNALGAGSRTVQCDHSAVQFKFSGTHTLDSPIRSDTFVNVDPGKPYLDFAENANITFNGKVSWLTNARLNLGKNATATFKKGIQADLSAVYAFIYLVGSGALVVDGDTPLTAGESVYVYSGNPVTLDLRVPKCSISGNDWCQFYAGKLLTRVENALTTKQRVRLGSTTWDLCGKNQRVDVLATSESGSAITSEEPATLTIESTMADTGHGGVNRVNKAVISGKVSVVKAGDQPHAIGATSQTEGSVEVKQGTLTFTATGKWPNATGVSVTGGNLVLQNAEATGSNAIWRVTSGKTGIVALNFAGTNYCEKLYVDGHRKGGGVYGGAGSGATCEVEWLEGEGVLKVAEHGLRVMLW